MRDPIWAVMEVQGRRISWLGEQIGLKKSYLSLIKAGRRSFPDDKKAMAARALQMPEEALFRNATKTKQPEEVA